MVLHYSANQRRIESGELVVMDVGGEYAGYATDVTRTVPANGKFTPRQREIYDIVLAAQKAAIAAVKPGMTLLGDSSTSLRKIALDYINTHGKDLHGEPLGKYFVHGLGHYVGLDVHDPGSFDTRLEPGMVITIEPGIYIPEENLGVRIEDTVVVTATGAEVLSSALAQGSRRDREAGWQVSAISFTSQCWPHASPLGTLAGWTALAARVDHYAYDLMTQMTPLKNAEIRNRSWSRSTKKRCARVAACATSGRSSPKALEQIAAAQPKAVALDVILSDKGDDAEDARLEAALRDTRNLVLPCDLVGGAWEDPLPRFASAAAALGHVHPEIDRFDGVSREVSLEETANHQRRWALALEAFRISRGQEIIESPDDVAVGGT